MGRVKSEIIIYCRLLNIELVIQKNSNYHCVECIIIVIFSKRRKKDKVDC